MFERFTEQARATVIEAQRNCRELGARAIEGSHLLLALVSLDHPLGGGILRERGMTADDLAERVAPQADASLLETLGIDVQAVRDRVTHAFGEGALERARRGRRDRHIPFADDAKAVLEGSLREAIARKDTYIGPEHVLLGMFREAGQAAEHLAAAQITRQDVEAAIAQKRDAA